MACLELGASNLEPNAWGRFIAKSQAEEGNPLKSLTKEQQKELDKDNAYSLTAPKMKRSTTLWSRVKTTKRSDKSTNARIANLENNLVARSRWMRGGSTSMSESERSALF